MDAGAQPRPGTEPSDESIRDALFSLLNERAEVATVCPSEVARRLAPDGSAWRALMPRIRAAAGHLASQGRLRVTRGGVEVDAASGGGPIRLGRPPQRGPA